MTQPFYHIIASDLDEQRAIAMMKRYLVFFWISGSALALPLTAQILHVPSSYPFIQDAIEASKDGDTVIVAPGHYHENINFNGKNIVLSSEYLLSGIELRIEETIINGDSVAPTITLANNETKDAQIIGLTIIGGSNIEGDVFDNVYGGGIVCVGASPQIQNNIISNCVNNYFNYSDFVGIYCENSEATIMHNKILHIYGFFTEKLGGIVGNGSRLFIRNNRISDISGGYVFFGGGISADSSYLVVERNIIDSCSFDAAPYNASVKIRNSESMLNNNTLIGEVAIQDSCLMNLMNNIIQLPAGSQSSAMVEMDTSSFGFGVILYNLFPGALGENGNIDADPLFADRDNGDYRLTKDSPCIDAGNPLSLYDPDETISDMGALYYSQISSITDTRASTQSVVFPNPAISYISTTVPLSDVTVMDMSGRVIKEIALTTLDPVDISFLMSGTYILTGTAPDMDRIASIFTKL